MVDTLNREDYGAGASSSGAFTLDATNSNLATDGPNTGESDFGAPRGGYWPVSRLRRQYLDYIGVKQPEIEEQKVARQYYHGSQWTADELRILRRRRQPVVTYNRVNRKINSVVGMMERLRQDPKAFPRNPNNEEGAEVATQAVRSVLDGCQWQMLSSEAARQALIDGISGLELRLTQGDKGDPTITAAMVYADDFFYDARSNKFDFGDSRYHGLAKWLDEDAAVDLFPEREEEIRGLIEYGSDLTTNADREFKWVMVNEHRVRLVEHWYLIGKTWCWAFYIGDILLDQGTSPFIDHLGQSMSRFIMFAHAVDQDSDRYGMVRNLKGPQDEINQRRSKALHISNSRRLIAEKGAVDDVERARIEWSRPDGYLEKNPGKEIKPDDKSQDLQGQLEFLQEAKQEIDSVANVTPTTLQGDMPRNMSGRAINLLQQGATAELGPFVVAYRDWKLRVYRAIWSAIQRFWQAERWVRITNDQGVAQFLQVNGVDVDQWGRPAIVNAVGQLDVEIVLDEGPDVINLAADTFDVLTSMAQAGAQIPPQILIEMAPIQGSVKKKLLDMLEQKDPVEVQGKQLELGRVQAEIDEKNAGTVERRTRALRNVASAAHAASEAHTNAAQFVRAGLGLDPMTGQPPAPATPPVAPGAPPMGA